MLLDEKKTENVVTLDLKKLTTFTDYFIIATANSQTHLIALAKEVIRVVKEEYNLIPLNPFDEGNGPWILIDYQDFIIHLFLKETREYYNLEELWFEARKYVPQ